MMPSCDQTTEGGTLVGGLKMHSKPNEQKCTNETILS